jgi:hypothetical protein
MALVLDLDLRSDSGSVSSRPGQRLDYYVRPSTARYLDDE